jgi:cytochrome c biogenesis protein
MVSREQEPASVRRHSVLSDIGSFFTSARTTIAVLFLLASTSILGTVVPQEAATDLIRQVSSSFLYRLIVILDLNNVYRSWWFILLLVLLSLNLVGCLAQRLPRIPGEWSARSPRSSFHFMLSDERPSQQLTKVICSAMENVFRGSARVLQMPHGVSLVWVKHRAHLLGFPFIHLAIIMILAGGLIGLVYGIKGRIQIVEGEVRSEFTLLPGGQRAKLPFEIAVDKFTLTRYTTGEPKEFRSDVRLLMGGQEVLKGPILVNDPLTFQGISLYQSDYRATGVREVNLEVISPSGEKAPLIMKPRNAVQLPGTSYELQLTSFDPGATRRGPGVEIRVQEPGKAARSVELFKNDPRRLRLGDREIRYIDYVPVYATGLQIGYDPGSRLVWAGCVLLILGFYLSLFSNYRSVHVEITSGVSGSSIRVSGRSKRLRREFRETVEKALNEVIHKL